MYFDTVRKLRVEKTAAYYNTHTILNNTLLHVCKIVVYELKSHRRINFSFRPTTCPPDLHRRLTQDLIANIVYIHIYMHTYIDT